MFLSRTPFLIYFGFFLFLRATLDAQSLRVETFFPPGPYTLEKSYSFWLDVASTRQGSFSVPRFDETPSWEITLQQQVSQSFVENEQTHYGVRYTFQFVPKTVGTLQTMVRLDWTDSEKKETKPCPPKQITLEFRKSSSLYLWLITLILGFFYIVLMCHRKQKQKHLSSPPSPNRNTLLIEKLSELGRFRMEGDFKSYFAGLEQLYSQYAEENKTSPEYVEKNKELKHFSERVRFASQEVNPNDLEKFTEYLKQCLSKQS